MLRWIYDMLQPRTLIELIEAGDAHELERRLQRGLSPNATAPDPEEGEAPLLQWAVGNNQPGLAALLLSYGASPNAATARRRTALHLAVLCDSPGLTALLLAHGADPGYCDTKGIAPLHEAALNNFCAVAIRLLDAGAPLEPPSAIEGAEGATPLLLAVGQGHLEMATLLLERGADPGARYHETQGSALHVALEREDSELAALLLRHGASLAVHNLNGDAPLHYCLGWSWQHPRQQVKALRLLLEAGADANALSSGEYPGRTPLNVAVRLGGDPQLVALLLRHGADIALRPRDGEHELYTAFEVALRTNNCAAARVLADAGARLDNAHPGGRHTLVYLVEHGFGDALRIACATGGDPNLRVHDGEHEFPLAWGACIANRPALLALLVESGARLDDRSSFGAGLLHAAAEQDALLCAQWLVEHGFDPQQTDDEGFTPLHVAAGAGAPALVELLLRAGADPNARGRYGRQPLDLLNYNHERIERAVFRRIEQMLIANGATLSASYH